MIVYYHFMQYLLAWFDRDFIKAGELAALIALDNMP